MKMKKFFIRVKILSEKNAYLLELLEDTKNLYWEHETVPFITDTKSLRRYLEKNFKEQIEFFNSGGRVIVYSAETFLCQYVTSTLQGFDVRGSDLVKAFSAVLRGKILPPSLRFQEIDKWSI